VIRIVYLHGFASGPSSGKARYFRDLLERHGAEVHIPDLAAGDFEHLTLSSQLDVVDRAVAGRPVVLIGSSMGGYLSALYAARHPEVSRIVLLAPAFGFPRLWHEREGAEAIAHWRSTGAIAVFHYGEGCVRQLGYQLLVDAACYEDYPDARQPALIFHGAQDDIVPVKYSEHFVSIHSNARLEVLESGHDLHDVLDHMGAATVRFLGVAG
jgi:uncharacterized protein